MSAADSVDWIVQHSRRYPLLTPQQEIELSRQVQAWLPLRDQPKLSKREKGIARRGQRAFETFFLANIRLVVTIASKYTQVSGTLQLEDLIQEGMLGLERAIVKFDHTRGYKFSTYAFNWIRQSIFRGISNKARTIRLPCSAFLTMRAARRFIADYHHEHGKAPELGLVAEHCKIQVHTLRAMMRHDGNITSLDANVNLGNDDGSTYLDFIPDPSSLDDQLDDLSVDAAKLIPIIEGLCPEDQQLLQLRYFHSNDRGASFNAIASQMGISRSGALDRHSRCLKRIRRQFHALPAADAARPDIPAPQCA